MNTDSLNDFTRRLQFTTEPYDPLLVTPTKQKDFENMSSRQQALIEDNEVAYTRTHMQQLNHSRHGGSIQSKLDRFLSPSPGQSRLNPHHSSAQQHWSNNITSPQVVKLDFANVKRSGEKSQHRPSSNENQKGIQNSAGKQTHGSVELVPFEMEVVTDAQQAQQTL